MSKYVDRPESEVRLHHHEASDCYVLTWPGGRSLVEDADHPVLDALAKAGVIGVAVDRPSEEEWIGTRVKFKTGGIYRVAHWLQLVDGSSMLGFDGAGATWFVHEGDVDPWPAATRDVDPEPTVPVAEVRGWWQSWWASKRPFSEVLADFDARFGGRS